MLSGSRTFGGDTISDTLAAVLKSEPDWGALPAGTRPPLVRLLRRCLEKDRRRRLRDIGEARLAIEQMLSGGAEEEAARPDAPESRAPSAGRALPILIAVAITAAATAAVVLQVRPSPADQGVQKYEFAWPGMILDETHMPSLSPDGKEILFATPAGLRVRSLDDLESRLLAGTERASHPFWSPDGTMIGFSREGSLWKIPAGGGQASAMAVGVGEISNSGRVFWNEDGEIIYSTGSGGISEISNRGGEPRSIAEPDLKEVQDLHQPHMLPGGRGVLYVAHRVMSTYDSIRVRADGVSRTLLQFDNQEIRTPVYSPTGHLLYRRNTGNAGLWAAPFSLSRLEVTGEPFLVAREGSIPSPASDGSLLFAWRAQEGRSQLVWLDRQGGEIGTVGPEMASIQSPALSPDGRQVAVMAQENETWDIWILDIDRGTRTRLTFTPVMDWDPAWMPDSKNVLYWEGATRAVSMKPADGTGDVERLVREDFPDSGLPVATPDGRQILFWVRNMETKGDLYYMPLEGDRQPQPFIRTPFIENDPSVSPDGEYAAYVSDESGRREVYLTRFPSAEGRWQISVSGGSAPRWTARGDRIFYLQGASLMEAEIATRPEVKLGTPQRLFTVPWLEPESWWANRYAISADGERFLFSKRLEQEGAEPRLVLVRNWIREFTRSD